MKITKLLEITKITNGFPFKSSAFNSDGKGLLIIRIQDMEKGPNNNSKYWEGEYKDNVLITKGDLLVSLSGSFKVEKWNFSDALLNQRIIKIDSKDEKILLNGYLHYFLTRKLDEIKSKATNTSIPNISVNDIKNLEIPLPSLQHQKDIVNKLDKLSELIILRKESIKKQEDLTKSIFIEMFGDPMLNEKDWEISNIGNIGDEGKYSIVDGPFGASLKLHEYVDSGIPVIRINNIKPNKYYNGDYKYITEEKYNSLIRSKVDFNDILIARVGNTIGKSCIYNLTSKALLSTTGVCKIRVNRRIINELFLCYMINLENFQNYILTLANGAGQPYFNLTTIKSFKIILPPISLQNKFAEIVQKNEENIKKQKESLEKFEELYSATMQESFRF